MSAALSLYHRKTQAQLVAMQEALHLDPASLNLQGGIHLFTPKVRKKLDDIGWAITYHLDDKRDKSKSIPTKDA